MSTESQGTFSEPIKPTFDDLSEKLREDQAAYFDRPKFGFNVNHPEARIQASWMNEGYFVLENFIPDHIIEAYMRVRDLLPKDIALPENYYTGWASPTPYMDCEELKDIALFAPLMSKLKSVIGETMALHLNLTGYISTERNWHADTYLNPDNVGTFYLATWIALDNIDPRSGPFEFIPKSHKWPLLKREKVKSFMRPQDRDGDDWPKLSEKVLNQVYEERIARYNLETIKFIPQKGDVLVWHSNLAHRGSTPEDKTLLRKSLISHYSAVTKRPDMRTPVMHKNGEYYFPF